MWAIATARRIAAAHPKADPSRVDAPPTAALRALAAWLPELSNPAFDFGTWIDSRRAPDGVITMPYFELSEAGRRFVREMVEVGLDPAGRLGRVGGDATRRGAPRRFGRDRIRDGR